ncbi:MAG: hypothetical protein LBJ00_17190 [Planctomycetaceae bacterium]|jgi:hypothetical protein|nr:hypothetical protein [Planctomycetaceae bacterium]
MKWLFKGEAYRPYRLRFKGGTLRNGMFGYYTQAVLKFLKLNAQAQQREAVVQGRSLSPYRLRYIFSSCYNFFMRLMPTDFMLKTVCDNPPDCKQ